MPAPALHPLLTLPERGCAAWWRQLAAMGAPLLQPCADGQVLTTFVWQDPHGDERHSPLARVYLDLPAISDHHQPDPLSLARLPGSDIWQLCLSLPASWRGGYRLIPTRGEHLRAAQSELSQRQWWRQRLHFAQTDPLNHQAPRLGQWRETHSALHLPQAPPQTWWQHGETHFATAAPQTLRWSSPALGNQRRVWLYASGEGGAERPLVILLDGQHWAECMPVCPAIASATASGRLPPAVYLLIDVIDDEHRSRELPCNDAFWQALEQELLPQAARLAAFSADPARTVAAGQSYGGLAALYAALTRPARFGAAISLSGSFWWPYHHLFEEADGRPRARHPGARGQLAEQLPAQNPPAVPLRAYLEAGSGEGVMLDVNLSMRQALIAAGHQAHWRIFDGGHDWLCWRGGLLDGLATLLSSDPPTTPLPAKTL